MSSLSPRTEVFYARRVLERAVMWLYANDAGLKKPYQENLAALIHEPTFRDILPTSLFQNVRLIHKLGNLAVHSDTSINSTDALHAARMLHALLGWVARIYSRTAETIAPFDDSLIPRPTKPEGAGSDWKSNLQDRTSEQAQRNFTKWLPNTSSVDITKDKAKDDRRIVFSTYPTLMNRIGDERIDGVNRFGVPRAADSA